MKNFCTLSCLFLLPIFLYSNPVSFKIIGINSSCGNNNGSAQISNEIGIQPFTYLWSTGATTYSITNLTAGTYYVTVTDNNGSTATDSIVILDDQFLSNAILYYENNGQLTFPCPGSCNGSLYLFNLGCSNNCLNGTGPYSFSLANASQYPNLSISGNGVFPSINNICGDEILNVIVTDSYGCTGMATQFGPFTGNLSSYQVTVLGECNGFNNGRITIDETLCNFVAGYNIEYVGPFGHIGPIWEYPGIQVLVLDNLVAGNYQIKVTLQGAVQLCEQNFSVTVPNLGNNCGTISGKIFADTTADCIRDTIEPVLKGRIVQFTPGPYFSTSDNSGNYSAHLPYGTYIASTVSNANYKSVCDSSGIVLNSLNDSIVSVNLGDSINFSYDLSLGLFSSAARPGFPLSLYINVNNLGFDTCSNSTVTIQFPPGVNFSNCSLPYSVSSSLVVIDFGKANSFEQKYAVADFTIPSTALLGSLLPFAVSLNSNCPETNISNNADTFNITITGSFDPNEKAVLPFNGVDNYIFIDQDSLLTYTVRFQNTGTDTAFNIVVIDTLDENLNVASLQYAGSSHPSHWELTGANVLKVYFDNILLPDSNTNEPASHGAFSYKIFAKQQAQLPQLPTIVYNKADIYFDFNSPVSTNTVFNTLELTVGLNEHTNQYLAIYPNPVNDKIFVKVNADITVTDIRIVDLQGREVINNLTSSARSINISSLKAGVYLLKAKVMKGQQQNIQTVKIVKL